MKKVLLLLVVFFLLFGFYPQKVFAKTTCDACGYCQNGEKPGDWETCAKCVYGDSVAASDTLSWESNVDKSKSYTVFGCLAMGTSCNTTTDPDCVATAGAASFANFLLGFFSKIVGGISFLAIILGGIKVMMAKGDPDAMREGKRYVYGAILGLIIVTMSVLIVKIVGGQLLKIPYLQ